LLDRRASLTIIAAVPVGLVLGAAAWAGAGGAGFAQASIETAASGFPRSIARSPPLAFGSSGVTSALGAPLFPLVGGKNGVVDPAIRLEGVARSPGRIAALLAVDAKPSVWFALGETRDGVTLVEVLGSKVTVDTVSGTKEIRLGEGVGPAGVGGAPAAWPVASQDSGPPPGYRAPPAPASAPIMVEADKP